MKKLFVILFCFTATVFANTDYNNYNSNDTNSTTKSLVDTNISNNTDENLEQKQSIFLTYENMPSTIYVKELFAMKVKAVIANDDFEEITSRFENYENLKIINPDSRWKWFNDNIFYNTYYMKADNINTKLPDVKLDIYLDSKKIDSGSLEAPKVDIIKLKGTKYFSGVIAKSLKIKKNKTTQFDDKNMIIVLEIEAKQANLNDFTLKWVTRDGIDSSRTNLPFFTVFYYAIVPNFTKEFIFTYFNRVTNKFEKITLPIVLSDEQISTQIDLNPATNSLQIYKDSIYGFFAIIFIVLFIKRRKIVYVIFLFMLIALFIYNKNLFNSIKIDKGSKIRILPTKKSTIFYITDRTIYAQKLDSKNSYIKILLPNGKIGWIYVSKN